MFKFADRWLEMTTNERQDLTHDEFNYFIDPDFTKYLKLKMKQLQKQKYYYLITFTLDPNKNKDEDTSNLHSRCETFIEDQCFRPALQFKEFHYIKEYTKKGIAHWHCAVVSTAPVCKSRFKYYTQKYGSVDINKTKTKTIQESLNYISKMGIPTTLLN